MASIKITSLLCCCSSSDIRLVESGLHTLTMVFSRVHGVESWPIVQELVVYICTILDPKLDKEAGT